MNQLEYPKFRIRDMDRSRADKTLNTLENAIHEMFNQGASGLSTSVKQLHKDAYRLALHGHGGRLQSRLVNIVIQHLRDIAKVIESSHGGLFLEELKSQWLKYKKVLEFMSALLVHVDREDVSNLEDLSTYKLGLNLWRDDILRSSIIRDHLSDTLGNILPKERAGEVIDIGLMQKITKMFMDLGPAVYAEVFERPFLDGVADFYGQESQQLIAASDCSDYLKKAERRMNKEWNRAYQYTGSRDSPQVLKIMAVVKKEVIGNHMELLVKMENSGLVPMLVDDRYDDLARMYTLFGLFGPVDPGLQIICDVMFNYVRETGRMLVTNPEGRNDPVDLVQRLLDEKDKYDRVIHSSFRNDKTFQNALNSSFQHNISLNDRCPRYFSLFMDEKLRKGFKGTMSEEHLDTALDKVMMLFRHLPEKDVFLEYYIQHLAERLLSGDPVSDIDSETRLMVRMKRECGDQFTSKLETMLNDMKTSRDTMHAFNATLSSFESSEGPTFAAQVLTPGSWPRPTESGATCNLPAEILTTVQKFKAHYLSANTRRRLTWQTNMGTADLKATFGNGRNRRMHEINVSTYQMCVLVLFNTADKLSYREIEQATHIPAHDLKLNLHSLACVKGINVLRKEPKTEEVGEDDVFVFNHKFSSKSYKVQMITVITHKETEPDKQEIPQKEAEFRKTLIELAIVKLMKSRRSLNHNNIVAETIIQLRRRFPVDVAVIKKSIESLCDREYLERDSDDWTLFHYVP